MKHKLHTIIAAFILAFTMVAQACEYGTPQTAIETYSLYGGANNICNFRFEGNGELPVTVYVRAGGFEYGNVEYVQDPMTDNPELYVQTIYNDDPYDGLYVTDVSLYYSVDNGPIKYIGTFWFIPQTYDTGEKHTYDGYAIERPPLHAYANSNEYRPLFGKFTLDPPELKGKSSGNITVYMLPRFGLPDVINQPSFTNKPFFKYLLGAKTGVISDSHTVKIYRIPLQDMANVSSINADTHETTGYDRYSLSRIMPYLGHGVNESSIQVPFTFTIPSRLIQTYNFNGKRRLGR